MWDDYDYKYVADSKTTMYMAMFANGELSLHQLQLSHWTVWAGFESVWVVATSNWSHGTSLRAISTWLSSLGLKRRTWMGTNCGENGRSYAAWTLHCKVLLIGTFGGVKFRANDAGVEVVTDHNIEFLAKKSSYPLPLMSYTVGEQLPFGAVTGGRFADGSDTYVARVHHDIFRFWYFHPKSVAVYYEIIGVQARTSMDILVVL